jgi:hypothetical protein
MISHFALETRPSDTESNVRVRSATFISPSSTSLTPNGCDTHISTLASKHRSAILN